MKKKIILRWLKAAIFVYSAIGIALYYLQDKFLFHPQPLSPDHVFHFKGPFEEVKLPFNKTDTLSMIKFLPTTSVRKGVVLYFHGNKENVERFARFATNFTSHGYELWMEDYPGYGKSTGERTEKKMLEQALQIQKLALSKYGKDSIILYGKSLGTGIAAYVAANSDCRRLILETPYYSIPSLFDCYAPIYPTTAMSNYRLPVYEYLEDLKIPVSIFHGTEDWVVPYSEACKLRGLLKNTDEFITIQQGGHRNLDDFSLFHQKLDSLLQLP